jgi:hypothetical protein
VGTGNLILHSTCKAYGARVLIQAQSIMTSNSTGKDIIPPLSLDYDCCGLERKSTKLKDILLGMPMKNIVNHLQDLRLASHKVEEVDKLIAEQEWKIKQSKFDYHISFLSYVGIATVLFMIIFCYCCCKRKFPNFAKWLKDNNPCTTIVIKPKIINSVHSSKESLRIPHTRTSIKLKPSQEDAIEERKIVSLKACNKQLAPSGKI